MEMKQIKSSQAS